MTLVTSDSDKQFVDVIFIFVLSKYFRLLCLKFGQIDHRFPEVCFTTERLNKEKSKSQNKQFRKSVWTI